MMAVFDALDSLTADLPALNHRGHAMVDVGMVDRLFLPRPGVSLPVVTLDSWPRRKKRLTRVILIADPDPDADPDACTQGKTAFVQGINDRVHDRNGWPRVGVSDD